MSAKKKPENPDRPAEDPAGAAAAPPAGPPADPPAPAGADPGPDPFDPKALRLAGDFSALGVKKALLTVPVGRPDKAWWVRTHPDDGYRVETAVVELKADRETYLVAPHLRAALAGESTFGPRALFTAVTRQGTPFIWPVRLPGPDGKLDSWSRSALEAAERAARGWVRVASNIPLGAYDVFEATGAFPEPVWPDVPFKELLRVAFKGKFIDSLDHPVLRKLRGEV